MMAEWTIDSLKEHFEKILAERQKQIDAALSSTQLAIDKSETEVRAWRVSQNEWRGAMDDREKRFINQTTFDAILKAATDRLSLVERWQSRAAGVGAGLVVFGALVGAAIAKALGV